MAIFKENIVPVNGGLLAVSLASGASTQTTGRWAKMETAIRYIAICQTATLSAGTATYSFAIASDADGTGAAAIGSTLVHSAAASTGQLELNKALVTAAKPYVSVICTTAAGTGICGATVVAVEPRYTA
jgi:hypothetical protein